jgi:hypothetical protein
MEARAAGARSDAKVCLRASAAEGLSYDFADFLDSRPRVLGANGDGAPPPAHIHLNLEVDYSVLGTGL